MTSRVLPWRTHCDFCGRVEECTAIRTANGHNGTRYTWITRWICEPCRVDQEHAHA